MLDWADIASSWAYAYGKPKTTGVYKRSPEDFIVKENLDFALSGEGEHIWLEIEKTQQNTAQVAKSLARFFGIAAHHVGFSGRKDFFAKTTQWFSVPVKQTQSVVWSDFLMQGVRILQKTRHTRKLKLGTHKSNTFDLVLRDIAIQEDLTEKVTQINRFGVPNYFAQQRFGKQFSNMQWADDWLVKKEKTPPNAIKKIVVSATRSWLFNILLDDCVQQKIWNTIDKNSVMNLAGSSSYFISDGDDTDRERLKIGDIHPSCALWGSLKEADLLEGYYVKDKEKLTDYQSYCKALEDKGLRYQRRATRIWVHDIEHELHDDVLRLRFTLDKGQFATSVLREILHYEVDY